MCVKVGVWVGGCASACAIVSVWRAAREEQGLLQLASIIRLPCTQESTSPSVDECSSRPTNTRCPKHVSRAAPCWQKRAEIERGTTEMGRKLARANDYHNIYPDVADTQHVWHKEHGAAAAQRQRGGGGGGRCLDRLDGALFRQGVVESQGPLGTAPHVCAILVVVGGVLVHPG